MLLCIGLAKTQNFVSGGNPQGVTSNILKLVTFYFQLWVGFRYLVKIFLLLCRKNTFDNIGEKHIIHFMGSPAKKPMKNSKFNTKKQK